MTLRVSSSRRTTLLAARHEHASTRVNSRVGHTRPGFLDENAVGVVGERIAVNRLDDAIAGGDRAGGKALEAHPWPLTSNTPAAGHPAF